MSCTTSALTSLQKHVSTDRALQQDRARHQHQQNPNLPAFRGPQDSRVEDEFAQFAGGPRHQVRPQPQHQHQHRLQRGVGAGGADQGWAADFRRLHVSHPPPTQQQQRWGGLEMGIGMGVEGAWHREFLSQAPPPAPATQPPPAQAHRSNTFAPAAVTLPLYTPHPQTQPTQQQYHHHGYEGTLEEAFDRAFESASQSLSPPVTATTTITTLVEPERETREEEDPDALSRTAGNLLSSLEGNTSAKFQQSNFLALMRRLRDREVRVEGDRMVEVGDGRSGGGIDGERFLEHSWWDL